MDRYQLAIDEGETGVKLSGGSPLMSAALAQTFAAAGRRSEAVEILDELTRLSKEKYIGPYFFAEIHAGLGQDDRAIDTWRNPTKNVHTGLSIFTLIRAWTACGPTRVFGTCCGALAFPYSARSHPKEMVRAVSRSFKHIYHPSRNG